MADDFRFTYAIQIRYGDIDAQRHVNNARYFTFMEQARAQYIGALGLWGGSDFDRIGIILAEQACTYLAPITLQQRIEIGVRTVRLGNKSIEMTYSLRDTENNAVYATGRSTLVTYDYQQQQSILIPDAWRQAIERFESGQSAGGAGTG